MLIGNSREDLQWLLDEFDIVCKRRKLKVNVGKSKVMVCGRTERGGNLDSSLNGEMLEEVDVIYVHYETSDLISIVLLKFKH